MTTAIRRRASVPLLLCVSGSVTGPLVPVREEYDHLVVTGLVDGDEVVVWKHVEFQIGVLEVIKEDGKYPVKEIVHFDYVQAALRASDEDLHSVSVYLEGE